MNHSMGRRLTRGEMGGDRRLVRSVPRALLCSLLAGCQTFQALSLTSPLPPGALVRVELVPARDQVVRAGSGAKETRGAGFRAQVVEWDPDTLTLSLWSTDPLAPRETIRVPASEVASIQEMRPAWGKTLSLVAGVGLVVGLAVLGVKARIGSGPPGPPEPDEGGMVRKGW